MHARSHAPIAADHAGRSFTLRRKCACGVHAPGGEECQDCARKRLHRKGESNAAVLHVPPSLHDVLATSGHPLEASTRAWMEPRFGSDFSHVRVHTDSRAAESARLVGALAYAVGPHVVFDQHQYAPSTPAGRHLLAHELAHTLQDPAASGMQASLAIGPSDDATEVAADRAADAVMRGQPVALASAGGGMIRRQMRTCSAGPGEGPDSRNVHCPDGSDYRVQMTSEDGPQVPGFHASATPGVSPKEIWLDIELCKGGTQVNIRPSIDIPQALASTVANLVAGSDALKGVAINPTLKFTLVQSQSFTLTVGPSVKVDDKGFAGAGGSVTVQTNDVTVKVGGTCDPRAKSCMFTLEGAVGKSSEDVRCLKKGKQKLVFHCEKITHVPGVPEVPAVKQRDVETRYVFFRHAKHDVRKDFRLPTDIAALNEQGYRVASIKGFTSPEGPRGKEQAPQFEGNVALANERAQAAHDWLADSRVCAGCDLSLAKQSGESELPPQQGREEPEPKGTSMEHAAIDEFIGKKGTPDPLAPGDPAQREKFEQMPFKKQRESAYELMRRAAIVFERTRTVSERKPAVAPRDEPSNVDCGEEVLSAAQKSFGIHPPGPFNFDSSKN